MLLNARYMHHCLTVPCRSVLHRCFRRSHATLMTSQVAARPSSSYALVENTLPVPCSSPADVWLKDAPRGWCLSSKSGCTPCDWAHGCFSGSARSGAYTTARTFDQNRVFELTAHVNRLASSCQQMLDNDSKVTCHPYQGLLQLPVSMVALFS